MTTSHLIRLTEEHYEVLDQDVPNHVLAQAHFAIEKNEQELERRALQGDREATNYLLAQCEAERDADPESHWAELENEAE